MLLNNNLFTQKQNNVRSNESMLNLDLSAITDMETLVSGTDSMNLLIGNWRNVASSGETFRNFACNDFDHALTKMQKSIKYTDQKIASGLSKGSAYDSINEFFKKMPPIDLYDDRGKYGGDQKDLGAGDRTLNWISNENEDVYNLIWSDDYYKDYSRAEVHEILKVITDNGCGFTATANVIFDYYRDKPEEFEKIFGFPLLGEDGDFNFPMLIVDVYLKTSRVVDIAGINGIRGFKNICKGDIDLFNRNFNMHCKTKDEVEIACDDIIEKAFESGNTVITFDSPTFFIQPFPNRFEYYCKQKGITPIITATNDFNIEDKITNAFNQGLTPVIGVQQFRLENEKGKVVWKSKPLDPDHPEDVAGHFMVVTGVAPDGRLIVSSWGEKYYLDLKDQPDKDYKVNALDCFGIKPGPNSLSPQDSKPYDDIGIYGGNAPGKLKDNYSTQELIDVMKRYPGYANCTEKDVENALLRFNKLGLNYVPMANSIYQEYPGRQKEFEEKFNIPMVRKDGELNIDLLAFTIFLETDRKVFFDEPEGMECCEDYIKDYYMKNPDVYKTNNNKSLFKEDGSFAEGMEQELNEKCKSEARIYKEHMDSWNENEMTFPSGFDSMSEHSFANRFSHYCKEHGLNVTIKQIKKASTIGGATASDVRNALARGEQLVCRLTKTGNLVNQFYNVDVEGIYEKHWDLINLTDVEETKYANRYVVSSAGRQYYIYPIDTSDIYTIKFNA